MNSDRCGIREQPGRDAMGVRRLRQHDGSKPIRLDFTCRCSRPDGARDTEPWRQPRRPDRMITWRGARVVTAGDLRHHVRCRDRPELKWRSRRWPTTQRKKPGVRSPQRHALRYRLVATACSHGRDGLTVDTQHIEIASGIAAADPDAYVFVTSQKTGNGAFAIPVRLVRHAWYSRKNPVGRNTT
jgi:hypothetical protein